MKYASKDCNKFVKDMERAGLKVEHYRGRNFWEGPAARVNDLQDALSETKIRCQWDQMGLGFIVYPRDVGGKPLDEKALSPVAQKVVKATEKAIAYLKKQATTAKSRDERFVYKKDAEDYEFILSLAQKGDVKNAGAYLRDLDTAARDYMFEPGQGGLKDADAVDALGFVSLKGDR